MLVIHPATAARFRDEAHYQQFRVILDDRDLLPERLSRWNSITDKQILCFTKRGYKVIEIEVDVDQYAHWCAVNGKRKNSHSCELFLRVASLAKLYE